MRTRLETIHRAAVASVEPGAAVRRAIAVGADGRLAIAGEPVPEGARLVVLAIGKAAAAMAAAVEAVAGARVAGGLAVVPDGYGVPLRRVALREAAHPLPDARSEASAREAIRVASGVASPDVLLVLLSGGASSLLACPAPGLTLDLLAETTGALLASGAPIDALNAVRKHLSAVAGGRLAQRSGRSRVEVLVISDVPGDDLDVIGSGPFAPDPTTWADALAVIDAHGAREAVPADAIAHLEAGRAGAHPDTPDTSDPAFAHVRHSLLASNATALEAACAESRRLGWTPCVVTGALRGEARVAGRRLAALGRAVAARPRLLLAGGETTVVVRGSGRGGRCQELALAAACVLEGVPDVGLLAAGTDGRDGPTDAAGAFVDGDTLSRGRDAGRGAVACLADNDAYGFFSASGGLLRTGPTRTNVMDLVLVGIGSGGYGVRR